MKHTGLTTQEARARLARDGENTLTSAKKLQPGRIFAGQFKDAMVIILLCATGVSVAMGEYLDAAAIIVVVVLNAILGFVQEYRAEKTLEALKRLSAPTAQTFRDGRLTQIDATQLVRGDVVRIEAGSRIPADCRLLSATAFEADESLLTGESLPIGKTTDSRVFMGTSVTRGHGVAEVIATGAATEMGKISTMLSDVKPEPTPLQRKLGELGRTIGLICIIVCIAVSLLGVIQGYGVFDMLLTGISLAVAAIPEGLPAVVTISLALAVRRIYKQKALVNKLHSVETLGCANVICTDKTGTLTQNKMKVTQVAAFAQEKQLLLCAALCNNESDPTELALADWAKAAANSNIAAYTRTAEIPFESKSQFMQVTTQLTVDNGQLTVNWLKGSLEAILPKCNIEPRAAAKIRQVHDEMTRKGLRCLALATNSAFLGIIGLSDPLRPEVKAAVRKCKRAGIRVIMLTGDHKNTAEQIAKQAGIAEVHARMTPADKLVLVKRLKAQGNIVAMTGDGVNDAPAVKEAAIGVAMGITGTDVTKEAAQLVLLDDNFATLVNAVEQGRTIYDNIRKSIRYMLSSNIGEVLTMLTAMLLGLPLVLIPIQILLINLVTDGLPAIALSMEPAADNIMKKPPRSSSDSVFAGGLLTSIAFRGIAIAACTLAVFWLALGFGNAANGANDSDLAMARTAAMATLGLSQLVFVFECKDTRRGVFNAKYRGNPHLIWAVLASTAIIAIAVTTTWLSPVLQTTVLSAQTLLIVLAFAAGLPIVKGIGKLLFGER
ncbi:MAG: cation-translocating P-type ATPase [Oscillospiraceae bacterium]|nr:cation-translocating P-type ATPase [Oscillospiraceae bacterium]